MIRDPADFDYDFLAWMEHCVDEEEMPVVMSVNHQGLLHLGYTTFSSKEDMTRAQPFDYVNAAVRAERILTKLAEDQDGTA